MYRNQSRRHGFTLVELLVVIVVIAILMGLLLSAIGPIRRTSYNFAISSEISELEGAIDKFKTKFGFYPPSEIGDLTVAADLDTFKQYLRRVAPNHEETDPMIVAWWTDVGIDLDNDSILVFWLSGLNQNAQYPLTSYGPDMDYSTVADNTPGNAFDAKNALEVGYAPPYAPAEKQIFFEFNQGQFQDVSLKVKRYLQRKVGDQPYVYFDSQHYATALCSVTDKDPAGALLTHPIYPYRTYPKPPPIDYYNPTTFQLVAAGVDTVFGAVTGPPPTPNDNWMVTNPAPSLIDVKFHRDNLTNFSGGILEREVQ